MILSPHAPDNRVQQSHATEINRYASTFAAAAEIAKPVSRVLSYGCSTGEEPVTLATTYFPSATIVGLDVDDMALRTARDRTAHLVNVVLAHSTPDNARRLAPYDVAFAMSVLCRWPETQDAIDISAIFPFAVFCAHIALLDECLRLGGLLVVTNSNYDVRDTALGANYEAMELPAVSGGFVRRFRPDGAPETSHRTPVAIFRKTVSTS